MSDDPKPPEEPPAAPAPAADEAPVAPPEPSEFAPPPPPTGPTIVCPQCRKELIGPPDVCPRCRTDLTLLTDFVAHQQARLAKAAARLRAGELAEAVEAYLEVLEIDPYEPTARRQVGRVATAVRHFDRRAAWRFGRWGGRWRWCLTVGGIAAGLLLAGGAVGYWLGKPVFTAGPVEVQPAMPMLDD